MMHVHIPAHGLVRTTIKVPSALQKGDVIPRTWLALPARRPRPSPATSPGTSQESLARTATSQSAR